MEPQLEGDLSCSETWKFLCMAFGSREGGFSFVIIVFKGHLYSSKQRALTCQHSKPVSTLALYTTVFWFLYLTRLYLFMYLIHNVVLNKI